MTVPAQSASTAFQRHATLADVIAWALAVPVLCATPFLFRVPFVMDRFQMEMYSLHAKLTHTTIHFLEIPLFAWIVVPLAVSIGLLAILVVTERPKLRIISSLVSLAIVGTMLWLMVWGMIFPSFQNLYGPLS